ncbi:MAG: hypothetical protein FJ298_01670 [Planctomycetes bacterium]|nr:hypothetical protein [Planctomycetota bacterium]
MASTLEEELGEALRAERGALAAYRRLAGYVRDAELARVLATFVEDEQRQIEELLATTRALGIEPVRPSLRRALLAELLAATVWLGARHMVLRLCLDAEETRARWYGHLGAFLREQGEPRFDASFARMARLKLQHARALGAWVRSD